MAINNSQCSSNSSAKIFAAAVGWLRGSSLGPGSRYLTELLLVGPA